LSHGQQVYTEKRLKSNTFFRSMDDSFCLSITMVLTLKDMLTAQKEDVFY